MMKFNKLTRVILACVITILSFVSCDKDVSDVGGEVLTSTDIIRTSLNNFTNESENISLATIQANAFSGPRFFGSSINDQSGTVNYELLYRVEPTVSTSELTDTESGQTIQSVKIRSANLIIPYTYTLIESVNDSVSRYQIANIVNEGQELNFDVFASAIDLELIDNSANTQQLYFANESDRNGPFGTIEDGGSIVEEILDANPSSEDFEVITQVRNADSVFEPIDSNLISDAFEDAGKTLRVRLRSDFLGEDFADSEGVVSDPSIFSSSVFLERFKGVYLRLNEGNNNLVSLFDNSVPQVQPKIEITFEVESVFISSENNSEAPEERTEVNEVTLDFNMNEQVVSLTNNEVSPNFERASAENELMLLKGGVSASRIQLFEDNSQLEDLFNRNPIINSAALRFYVNVNSDLYDQSNTPNNLWINDFETGNLISGAQLADGETENPFYEFTITQFMRNVLNVDNTSLLPGRSLEFMVGISNNEFNNEIVSEDEVAENFRQDLLVFNQNREQRVNVGSLLSTDEVPLFGTGASDESKRPQLVVNFATVE